MTTFRDKNTQELGRIVKEAARKYARNWSQAVQAGCDTITGARHLRTAERQQERMEKAVDVLVARATPPARAYESKW